MLRVMPAVVAAGGELPALVELDSTTLGAAASEITFSGFSADYTDLMVALFGRGDAATTAVNVMVRLNSDSGSNYDRQFLRGSAATVDAGETLGGTSAIMAAIPAASASAGIASGMLLHLSDYTRTAWQKSIVGLDNHKRSTSSGDVWAVARAAFWRSTSAITSVTLSPDSGNFDADTTATLWAWR